MILRERFFASKKHAESKFFTGLHLNGLCCVASIASIASIAAMLEAVCRWSRVFCERHSDCSSAARAVQSDCLRIGVLPDCYKIVRRSLVDGCHRICCHRKAALETRAASSQIATSSSSRVLCRTACRSKGCFGLLLNSFDSKLIFSNL